MYEPGGKSALRRNNEWEAEPGRQAMASPCFCGSRAERMAVSELFKIAELVKVAIEDEKTGSALYAALANKTRNVKLKDIFARLAEEERGHQKRFEAMLASLGDRGLPETYPGQYMAYLRALTDRRAFPDAGAAVRMSEQCLDDVSAIDLADRLERDTLILMHEMGATLPPKDRSILGELVAEEQGHLVTLAEARKAIAA